eukprot:753492-Hanusia_phi.AAC.1
MLQIRTFEGSLVGSWSFNGNLGDSSVSSNDLQGNNVQFLTNTEFQSILWGEYAYFSGDNSYARKDGLDLKVSNGDFTVEFWVKLASQQYNIFTYANVTTTFMQFWNANTQSGCQFEIGGEIPVIPDQGSSSLQLDYSIPDGGILTIGSSSDLSNFSNGTSESVADFRIWNNARSEASIQEFLYTRAPYINCPVGFEGIVQEIGFNCSLCSEGKYKSNAGTQLCISCPANSYSTTSKDSCSCILGYQMSNQSNQECVKCVQGKYRNNLSNPQCEICEAGTYGDEQGL